MKHILVATNNFWVGGRETYVAAYLRALARDGVRASLIATSHFSSTPEAAVFQRTDSCSAKKPVERFAEWLDNAERSIRADRPDVIWAHHFDLLPAWLVARIHRLPLLVTFHGPLVGDRRRNEPFEAVGMTLGIHRAETVSGVSEEIVDGLGALHQGSTRLALVPNAVELGSVPDRPPSRSRKLILVTRPEKQGHIRAAVRLFAEYRRRVPRSSLTIAAGREPGDLGERDRRGPAGIASKARETIRHLGGKWCWAQGPRLLASLPRIEFFGYVDDARRLIRGADVVLGMGRVLLEGLAEEKPSVLIGYEEPCGLLSADTFSAFRRSNFSGRGVPRASLPDICESIISFSREDEVRLEEHRSAVDVDVCARDLMSLLRHTTAETGIPERDTRLANELAQAIKDHDLREDELFSRIVDQLAPNELRTLFRVLSG